MCWFINCLEQTNVEIFVTIIQWLFIIMNSSIVFFCGCINYKLLAHYCLLHVFRLENTINFNQFRIFRAYFNTNCPQFSIIFEYQLICADDTIDLIRLKPLIKHKNLKTVPVQRLPSSHRLLNEMKLLFCESTVVKFRYDIERQISSLYLPK